MAKGGGAGAGWLAALPVVGNIIDTGVASSMSKKNVLRTIKHQKEESELAYQRQMEMWHLQNQYNSPEEQMKRFGAAGLNPHLIYGHGTPGNSSSTPAYHPPDIQYKYDAPAYGSAVGSVIPTLMAVGTWMQNMRQSEVDIQQKQTSISKTGQLIQQLEQINPRMVKALDNKLALFPYQEAMQRELAQKGQVTVADLLEEFRYKWGEPLQTEFADYKYGARGGGIKSVEFLKKLAEQKLKTAQASWTDFNITNPQALIQLVLGGVMGMAGQTLKLNTRRRSKTTHETESRMSTGRVNIRRRTYER